jgi:SagB-type dehydrogenase family enzyme
MQNDEVQATWDFHNATSYVAVPDASGGEQFMMGTSPDVEPPIWQEDWSLEPFPYKVYESLDPLEIPREFAPTTLSALAALARTGAEPGGDAIPDRAALARIALLSNGILKRGGHRPGGAIIEYRTSGGTGARYHLELYFVCGDIPGLDAGVYHYSAQDHSLRLIRAGDYRAVLTEATGREKAVDAAPVVLAMTSTFWRNAWRYKGRAYRHTFWDAGTTFANVLSLAASVELPARLVLGFSDAQVNALLDVDGEREATVALCAIGRTGVPAGKAPEFGPLGLPTRAISPREVEFQVIPRMHHASSLASGTHAAAWRARPLARPEPPARGDLIPLRPLPPDRYPDRPIEDVIMRRRSTRHYDTQAAIPFEAFSTLLDSSSRGVAADCFAPDALPLHSQYLIVNGVEGLEPGIYLHHPRLGAVELLRAGDFRRNAQRLAVEQEYAADAHVNSYYLTDLRPVLERYGNRGYRAAQLEAALYGSKLHLGTHALGAPGLGAVGSTSFDDEVVKFFSPRAAGQSYTFVVVFGRRRRRDTSP